MSTSSVNRNSGLSSQVSRQPAAEFAMFQPEGNAAVAALVDTLIQQLGRSSSSRAAAANFSRGVLRLSRDYPEIGDAAVQLAVYAALDRAGIPRNLQQRIVRPALSAVNEGLPCHVTPHGLSNIRAEWNRYLRMMTQLPENLKREAERLHRNGVRVTEIVRQLALPREADIQARSIEATNQPHI